MTDSSQSLDRDPELKGALIASLRPLRIHSGPSHPPRPPTLQECEVIIRRLHAANGLQSQEASVRLHTISPESGACTELLGVLQIVRVKALLREKITPESYILTKTVLADGSW